MTTAASLEYPDLGAPDLFDTCRPEPARVRDRVAETVRVLVDQLRTGRFSDRWSAASALGRLGASALPPLRELLSHDDRDVRWLAAFALGRQGASAAPALAELREALVDDDAWVRWAAAEAIGEIGPPAAEVAVSLVERLNDEDRDVARAAVGALEKIGEAAVNAVDALVRRLSDGDEWVRWIAISVLERIGPPAIEAVPALSRRLLDRDAGVRCRAIRALERVGAPAAPAIERLLQRSNDAGTRRAAAEMLGSMGDAAYPVTRSLIAAISDPAPMVRVEAARALGRIPAASAHSVGPLAAAVLKRDEMLQVAAAEALAAVGRATDDVVLALLDALGDDSPRVRIAAAHALTVLRPVSRELVDAILSNLDDADRDVRLAAIRAAATLGSDPRIVKHLVDLVSDFDAEVARSAGIALGDLGPAARAAVPTLRDMLDDEDEKRRNIASDALAHICAEDESLWAHPPVLLRTAILAVEQGALGRLERCLGSLDIMTRDRAGDTLLHHACWAGQEHCVRLLIEHGADVNATNLRDETPLIVACRENDACSTIIRLLLGRGANVDHRDRRGSTALIEAVSRNSAANVQDLLDWEPDADAVTQDQQSALSLAIAWNRVDLVKTLVRAGADVNLRIVTGATPLAYALGVGVDRRILRILLENGADPDRGTIWGTSYAMYALRLEDESLATEFLTRTRDLNYRDQYGYTLLGFARMAGLAKVARLLERLGAQE